MKPKYLLGSFAGQLINALFMKRLLARLSGEEMILSVYFHNPTREVFKTCIQWLIAHKFTFLSAEDLYALICKKRNTSFPAVFISLDDGWSENLENVLPVIKKFNVPVTIFVPSAAVVEGFFWFTLIRNGINLVIKNDPDFKKDRIKYLDEGKRKEIIRFLKGKITVNRECLNIEQIKEISALPQVTIGSHSVNHAILTNCTEEERFNEVAESRKTLEHWTGKTIDLFSYPNGNYGNTDIANLENTGYLLAFTTKQQYLLPGAGRLFELPRFCVPDDRSGPESIARMTGLWHNVFSKIGF